MLCKKCQRDKPQDQFGRPLGRTTRTGHDIYCKECRAAYAREKRAKTGNAYGKQYYQRTKNDPKKRAHRSAARARRRAALAAVPSEPIDIETLYVRDGGICQLCNTPVSRQDASIDHKVPISLGGPNLWSNVQLAHFTCNARKGNRV